jgi:hypothetical protein
MNSSVRLPSEIVSRSIHRLEFFRRQMEKVDEQIFTARRANNLRFRVFRDDKWDGIPNGPVRHGWR